jgi:hypothetical protein
LTVPDGGGEYQMYALHPKGLGFLVNTVNAGANQTEVSSPDPTGTLIVAKGWVGGLK